jgi:hypothetical protein
MFPINKEPKMSASTKMAAWSNELLDATWTQYGHLRAATIKDQGKLVAIPLSVSSPDQLSTMDFSTGTPVVRLGKTPNQITITPNGVRLKQGEPEKSWSKDVIKTLIETITKSEELFHAALSLRLAWHATYPEYAYQRKAIAPAKLAKPFVKWNASVAQFSESKSADHCRIENVVDTLTTTVLREQNIVVAAADQFSKCLSDCEAKFGGDWRKLGDKLLCEANCLGKSFVDMVIGTVEIVETITDTVVRQVLVCPPKLPKGKFPNPFTGLEPLPGISGAAPFKEPAFSNAIITQALDVLLGLVTQLPPVVTCLLQSDWKITSLGNLGLNIDGVASVPFGVTVCIDSQCAQRISGSTSYDISTIAALVAIASTITPATLVAAGISVAAAAVIAPACVLILGLLAVLLVHLAIVAGQILLYNALGMTSNGVCITHPSLPVVAATVLNPLLGILAVGNTPLVVTPA